MTDVYLTEVTSPYIDDVAGRMEALVKSRNLNRIKNYLDSGRYSYECLLDVTWRDEGELGIRWGRDLLAQVIDFTTLFDCKMNRERFQEYNDKQLTDDSDYMIEAWDQIRKQARDEIRRKCKPEELKAELEFRTEALLLLVKEGTALAKRNAYALAELLDNSAGSYTEFNFFNDIIASEIRYETWIEIAKFVVGDTILKDGETHEEVLNEGQQSQFLAQACLQYIVNPKDEHVALIEKLKALIVSPVRKIAWLDDEYVQILRENIPDFETTKYWRYYQTGAKGRCVREIIDAAIGLVGTELPQYVMLWIIQEALPECTSRTVADPILREHQVVPIIERIVKRFRETQEGRLLAEQQKQRSKQQKTT